MPICSLAAAPLANRVESVDARAAAGAILIAGGLAGLGLLPDASVVLTLPPQALVGVGLALTLSALTEAALAGRAPQAIHGGWTIAARHAGVVVGPAGPDAGVHRRPRDRARRRRAAGTAALLDARARPVVEARPRRRGSPIGSTPRATRSRLSARRSSRFPADPAERAATVALRDRIEDEVDAAATHAFSASFLIAAAFALAALIPIALARRRVEL